MSYPANTAKYGDTALAIKALAEYADGRLPSLGVETKYTGNITTNATGDVAIQFSTITHVQAILQPCQLIGGSGWTYLSVPVMVILSGSPIDTIWARAISSNGVYANLPVNLVAYGWGTPK